MAFPQYRGKLPARPSTTSLHIHPFPSPPLSASEPISPLSQSSFSTLTTCIAVATTRPVTSVKGWYHPLRYKSPYFFLDGQAAMELIGDIKPNGSVTLRRDPSFSQTDESTYEKIRSSMSLSVVLNAPSSTPPDCQSQTLEGAAFGTFSGRFEESPACEEDDIKEEVPNLKSPPETPPQVLSPSIVNLPVLRPGTLEKLTRAAEEDGENWTSSSDGMERQWAHGVDATSSTASSSTVGSLTSSATLASHSSTSSRRLSLRSSQGVPPEVRKLIEEQEEQRAREAVPKQKRITLKFKRPPTTDAPEPVVEVQPSARPAKRGRGRPRKHQPESSQPSPSKPVEDDQPPVKRRRLFSGAELKRRQEAQGVLPVVSPVVRPATPPPVDHVVPKAPKAPANVQRPRKRRSVEEPAGPPQIQRKQRVVSTHEERCPRPARHEHGLGLSNLGATCYVNVVLQVLAHTPALRDHFLARDFARVPADEFCGRPKASSKTACVRRTRASERTAEVLFPKLRGKLGEEFGKLIRELTFEEERKNGVASDQFWTALRANLEKDDIDTLDPNIVQDAHEFLIRILGALADEDSPVVDGYTTSQVINNTFAGTHATIFECNNCHATTRREDKCMELQVPICKKMPAHGHLPPSVLEDHLRNYTRPEDTDMRHTVEPKGKNACIELKRFLWDNGENRKVRGHVSFPLRDADLSGCSDTNQQADDEEAEEKEKALYDLYAVVVHRGDRSTTGHYIAFAKEGDQWLRFDDLKVHVVSEEEVARQEAYILLYEKQSTAQTLRGKW
ncbi:hypothetical protein ABW21_db0206617 [Orbilia brochopaga]|nr:hypothetical protein ABW21_db0206617 [Drechslerella brochopaga]